MINFYPELWAITGNTVPDYRGRFLRHVGGNSDHLGINQNDATRHIRATFHVKSGNSVSAGEAFPLIASGGAIQTFGTSTGCSDAQPRRFIPGSPGLLFDNSFAVPVSSEIRPINKAVKYLIRAFN